MKPIGFAFDNFNFVVYPLKLSGMDGIIAVVENPKAVSFEHVGKLGQLSIFGL